MKLRMSQADVTEYVLTWIRIMKKDNQVEKLKFWKNKPSFQHYSDVQPEFSTLFSREFFFLLRVVWGKLIVL